MSTGTAYLLSEHAQERRKQMGVSEDRIGEALRDPQLVYPSSKRHPDPDVRRIYQREEICVIVDESTHVIITVLWHRREGR